MGLNVRSRDGFGGVSGGMIDGGLFKSNDLCERGTS